MWHHRQGASAARLERDNLSGADAFVRSEHDSQAVDRILHVIGQIQILLDGAQQIGLLSIAEPLVIRFVLGVDQFVAFDELVVLVDVAMVQLDAVGFGVAVDVVGPFGA